MRGIRRPNAANEDAPLGLDARSAERLLEHAQEHSDPTEGALVVLLLLRGLRISEALSLRAGDIALRETGTELRILSKGRTARESVYSDDRWLTARLAELAGALEPDGRVFGELDRFAAARVVKTIGAAAGLRPAPPPPPATPHVRLPTPRRRRARA